MTFQGGWVLKITQIDYNQICGTGLSSTPDNKSLIWSTEADGEEKKTIMNMNDEMDVPIFGWKFLFSMCFRYVDQIVVETPSFFRL